MIRLIAQEISIDAEAGKKTRSISGVAVPWNTDAIVSGGEKVRFLPGSLPEDGKAPRLVEAHDISQILGLVTERVNTEDGMMFTAKIAATRNGDDALELLKMGALDSVSVGANPIEWEIDAEGTMVISRADWVELSLVAIPAFSAATITEVAASSKENKPTMSEITPDIAAPAAEAPATLPTPAVPIYAEAARPMKLPSPGEYLAKLRAGGSEWQEYNAQVTKAIRAATGDVVISDADGVIPTPIVAPIYDSLNPLRPIVTALGVRSMPTAGATFIRPFVKVRSAAAVQANELAALTTADFEVDDIVVTKKTFGGKLVLSEQVIDFSSPSMLDAAINDMAGQYALATEKEVVDRLAAGSLASSGIARKTTDLTSASAVIKNLYTEAANIGKVGNYLPNVAVVSPEVWAELGGLVDSQNRPVFPQISPLNGIGNIPGGVTSYNGNPLGLQLVVSNQVKDQTVGNKTAKEYIWLMNSRGVEVYENFKGFLRDESPGTLSVTLAVRGYFAAHVIDTETVIALGPAATFGGG